MIKKLVRYVYEYYRYGGFYPWLASHISRGLLPIAVYWSTHFYVPIPMPIGVIVTAVSVFRCLWAIFRHLSGMLAARSIYADILVSDDLLTCTSWKVISIKLAERGILDMPSAFGGEKEALSRVLADVSALLPTTTMGVDILRRALHRSLRASINLRISLVIEALKEFVMYPFGVLERLSFLLMMNIPLIYSSPSHVVSRVFYPTIIYTLRREHEMEFEASEAFSRIEPMANDYLSQFPSPLLDAVYRLLRVPLFVLAGYLLYIRHFEFLVPCIVLLGIVSDVSSPGKKDPSALFVEVNSRFRAVDAVALRDCLMNEHMTRHGIMMAREIVSIFLAPMIALTMISMAAEIYETALRKIIIVDGVDGWLFSTRVYRHVTMFDDEGLSRSTRDMMYEFDGLLNRVEI